MNVAFWSNTQKSGVSTNLAALACLGAYEYPLSITMLENHLDREGLGRALLGCQWDRMVHEPRDYYYAGGQNDLFIKELSKRIHRRFIDSTTVEIIEDSLTYVYQNFMVSPELFEYDFCRNMLPKIENNSSFDSVCFIDTAAKNNLSTKEILDKANIVVINLRQSLPGIRKFFEEYSSLIPKAVFIISDFHRKNPINRRFFAEKYGIPPRQIGVVPHSENLYAAVCDGSIPAFISRNRKLRRGEDYYLISELKRSLYMLVDNMVECGVNSYQKEYPAGNLNPGSIELRNGHKGNMGNKVKCGKNTGLVDRG